MMPETMGGRHQRMVSPAVLAEGRSVAMTVVVSRVKPCRGEYHTTWWFWSRCTLACPTPDLCNLASIP